VKRAKSKPWHDAVDASHTAVSAKTDDTSCQLENDGAESKPSLSMFRIPRIPNREGVRSNNASDELRCDTKTVKLGPVTSLKMDSSSKANVDAACVTDIHSRNSSVCNRVRSGCNDAVYKHRTLHGSSKLTGGVHSQSAKPRSDLYTSAAARIGGQQLQSSAANHDKPTVAQSELQELTPTKAVDTLCQLEKDDAQSKPNLSVFRIPRIPYREGVRSNNASDELRCERKTVNFVPVTSLKMDSQKNSSSKANVSAACVTDIHSHKSSVCSCVRSGQNDAVSKPHMLHGSSDTRNKLTGGVHSQSAKCRSESHISAGARAGRQQLQSSAVSRDKATVTQSDPQESTPKLPEYLTRAGWKLCWSKQRHRWYVFNVRTGTSSWDVPK